MFCCCLICKAGNGRERHTEYPGIAEDENVEMQDSHKTQSKVLKEKGFSSSNLLKCIQNNLKHI